MQCLLLLDLLCSAAIDHADAHLYVYIMLYTCQRTHTYIVIHAYIHHVCEHVHEQMLMSIAQVTLLLKI